MCNNHQISYSKALSVLSLQNIAAWQIADEQLVVATTIVAGLPALQRGSVWKPQQVEEVWDSLVQGFPVGAFLVSPIKGNNDLGKGTLKYGEDGVPESTYYLLDGQQRATSIALGFKDIWRDGRKDDNDVKGALWVDLDCPPERRDVEFVFRVLTKAHPWGYMRDYQRPTLHLKQIREWLVCLGVASGRPDQKIKDILLKEAWPYDALAPLPVAFLMLAAKKSPDDIESQGRFIFSLLEKTAFWNSTEADWHKEQKVKVEQALLKPNAKLFARFKFLMKSIVALHHDYGIPVQILNIEQVSDSNVSERPDPIETLFVRVNSKGTPLEGEELIYSLLKSDWKEAPDEIGKFHHKMASASRLVLFCTRLVLARTPKDKIPPAPKVRDFRRLMRKLDLNHQGFKEDLQNFISGGAPESVDGGRVLFQKAYEFLTKAEYALPPVLATEIAQHSPEVFFLLLRWLDLMHKNRLNTSVISEDCHRQTLGFLTALAWFSNDRGESAAAKLWPHLNAASNEGLVLFFDSKRFGAILKMEQGALPMIPLISPHDLESIIKERVLENIHDQKSSIWKSWNLWDDFSKELPLQVEELFNLYFEPSDDREIIWNKFVSAKLWGNRSILLYAQRKWLNKWFDFDPSEPEYLEDKNRPWDYDHIHPQNFVKHDSGRAISNIPSIIAVWHRSIGNLRAWPLDANRADHDFIPAKKLCDFSNIKRCYGMNSSDDLKQASFIDKDWQDWQASAVDQQASDYLLLESEQRVALVRAMTTRFVRIYSEWYQSLRIDLLMHNGNEK